MIYATIVTFTCIMSFPAFFIYVFLWEKNREEEHIYTVDLMHWQLSKLSFPHGSSFPVSLYCCAWQQQKTIFSEDNLWRIPFCFLYSLPFLNFPIFFFLVLPFPLPVHPLPAHPLPAFLHSSLLFVSWSILFRA